MWAVLYVRCGVGSAVCEVWYGLCCVRCGVGCAVCEVWCGL